MTSPSPAPNTLVQSLGYAGLVPFFGLAVLLWIVPTDLRPWLSWALASYAALIASFLGGMHWGLNTAIGVISPKQQRFDLIWGISLLAWIALLMPARASLPLLAALLIACYWVDRKSYPAAGWSAWLPMRLRLTTVAALSCLIGAGAI
jgi:Protein of unknown function (DUF3429)